MINVEKALLLINVKFYFDRVIGRRLIQNAVSSKS